MSITSYFANKLQQPVGVSSVSPNGNMTSRVVNKDLNAADPRNTGVVGMDNGDVNVTPPQPVSGQQVQVTESPQPAAETGQQAPVQTEQPVQTAQPVQPAQPVQQPQQAQPEAQQTQPKEQERYTFANKDDNGGDVELADKDNPYQKARENAMKANEASQRPLLESLGLRMEQLDDAVASSQEELERLERRHRLERGERSFWMALRQLANLAGTIVGSPVQEVTDTEIELEQKEYENAVRRLQSMIDKYKLNRDDVVKDYIKARSELEKQHAAVLERIDLAEAQGIDRRERENERRRNNIEMEEIRQANREKNEQTKLENQKQRDKTLHSYRMTERSVNRGRSGSGSGSNSGSGTKKEDKTGINYTMKNGDHRSFSPSTHKSAWREAALRQARKDWPDLYGEDSGDGNTWKDRIELGSNATERNRAIDEFILECSERNEVEAAKRPRNNQNRGRKL